MSEFKMDEPVSGDSVAVGTLFEVDKMTYMVLTDFTVQVGNGKSSAIDFDEENEDANLFNGELTIPATVNYKGKDYVVTGLGDRAFRFFRHLTSVVLPASLTVIGDRAFSMCTGLTSFIVSPKNPSFCAVDGVLFSKDKTCLVKCPPARPNVFYAVPDGVTHIRDEAFHACEGLISVLLPVSLTHIGDQAFFSCSYLNYLTLPASLTHIGDQAFLKCLGLTSVTLPVGLTHIGDRAFSMCTGLTFFIVPPKNPSFCDVDGVLFSKDKTCLLAYPRKKKGSSYVIPDGVTSLGGGVFYGCNRLTSVTLPASLTHIGGGVFYGCNRLTFVSLPKALTSIGDWAFSECSGLTSVSLPKALTSIGDWAFSECSSLTSVTIPESLKNIGDFAFSKCDRLTSVMLSESLTNIGSCAFRSFSELKAFIVVPENPAYCAVDGVLFSKDKTRLVAYPKKKKKSSYIIPDGVTSIGDEAFCDCRRLTSVELPESLTSIGRLAFCRCDGLTSVTLPESVTSIGQQAFFACGKLTNIRYLGTHEPSIGSRAFDGFKRNSPERVLHIPNVTSGFDAEKWGAFAVVYHVDQ